MKIQAPGFCQRMTPSSEDVDSETHPIDARRRLAVAFSLGTRGGDSGPTDVAVIRTALLDVTTRGDEGAQLGGLRRPRAVHPDDLGRFERGGDRAIDGRRGCD